MKHQPKAGEAVFFTYKGTVRAGHVDKMETHASAGTPYAVVTSVDRAHGRCVSHIHPEYLFSTEVEAREADPYRLGRTTLDRIVAEKTEYARIAAGSPPEWVAKQREGCVAAFEHFKDSQVKEVRKIYPDLSEEAALAQFAHGMRIFDVLSKAHQNAMCAEFSHALLETMPPAVAPAKIYSLHIRDRWGGDNTTLHQSAEERDLSLCEWLEGNGSLEKLDVRRVLKAIAAGNLDRANELMCHYADSSGHEWTRSEHEIQKRTSVEIAVTEEGETESEQTSTGVSV